MKRNKRQAVPRLTPEDQAIVAEIDQRLPLEYANKLRQVLTRLTGGAEP